MGVKDLWAILSPVSEKKSLWDLQNKNIAVDLSAWICDSQNVGDQRNMHLRNLFFRTSFLLLLGCKPVFVLEGAAPELKHKTIAARSQLRGGRDNGTKTGSRARLKSLQKQCERFLMTMGVACVQATGEAEAYCAWLNDIGVVDAVITQDSDSFLYGARTVLRNFTMSPTFVCEEHSIDTIESRLSLGRFKLMALSLLCGCDYNKGVSGVGKESAMKFLTTLEDLQVIRRLRSWKDDPYYSALENKKSSQLNPEQKIETSIRKKALQDPDFPSQEIIDEYLKPAGEGGGPVPKMEWTQPDLPTFIKLADRHLAWDDVYAVEKFLPLLTRWHLLNYKIASPIRCETIVKKRVVRGIKSYEVRWSADFMFDSDEIELVTVEPQDLLSATYQMLVEEYVAANVKPKKVATRKKRDPSAATLMKQKTLKDITNVSELLNNLSFDEKNVPKKQPTKKRLKDTKGLQTIDKFFTETNTKNEPDVEKSSLIGERKKNFVPLLQSTPNKPMSSLNVNDLDVSFHYTPDKPCSSVLRRKANIRTELKKQSLLAGEREEDVSENNESVRCKVNDFSLLELYADDADQSCFDMSNIINGIVSRNCENPALNILLNLNNH